MGRGDKKTKKGKIFKGSFGVARPKKTSTVLNKEIKTKKTEKKVQKEVKRKKKSVEKK
tara:strand:- start:58 stop:231 length:174 start_codon:yes stop_codon:yes gene_type:complete